MTEQTLVMVNDQPDFIAWPMDTCHEIRQFDLNGEDEAIPDGEMGYLHRPVVNVDHGWRGVPL